MIARTTARLLRLVAPLAGWFGLAALLGCATIASSLGLMATSAYLIAAAALKPSIAALQVAIVGVRFFGIARGLLRYAERYTAHTATFRLLARLRAWFYRAAEPLAPAGLLGERSGDLLTRVVADVATLEQFYLRAVAPPVVALLVAGLAGALLGWLSIWLGLALVGALVLAGVGLPLLTLWLSRSPGERAVAARAALDTALVEGVQGAADLLAFGRAEQFQAELAGLGRRLARAQERLAAARGLHGALSGLLASLAGLATLAIATPLVRAGRIDGVYLALIALAATAAFEAVAPLGQAAEHLGASLAAARRLFAIADRPAPVRDPANPAPAPFSAGVEVRDLSFAYPPSTGQEPTASSEQSALDSQPPALAQVNLSLPPGARVALVGPSGAGKSTLAQVLLRLWEYRQGEIWLGDRELRQCRAADVRRMIGVVAQDTHLFNATVRTNLLLARPGASQAELDAAAEQAQLRGVIQALPQGYDTWIGEQGLRLSGGERQRLAIARAILQDAPLLILDEPTAHLDEPTSQALLAALDRLMESRTTLLITHRLAGLEAMDTIVVLDGGRVVEQGRHHELLRLGGCYQRMWEQQAAN